MNQYELNAYLASIIESSDDAIISKDLNGIIQSFNRSAERMFGWTAAEIVGMPVTTLIPPDRQHEEKDILARLRRGERVDHFETVRIAKDGRLVDISLTVSPIRGPTGEIVGASKIARDISERKRAAKALAEQREWFRITLNSIGDGVIASDCDGRVTFFNHEAEKLTGWPATEAEGKLLAEVFRIISEESRKPVENPAVKVIQLGHVVGLANHTALISRDGTEWPIADSAAPIVDHAGNILGVVLVFREITELKRSQGRARDAALERERLLQNERASRGEAERANRVKDDFVAMVSHELRTPLNAILGWTDILKQQNHPDTATFERGIEVIARNTRLQAQLISDLLDVSRIVSGKLSLEMDRVDLAQLILTSVEGLQPSAMEKGVELNLKLEEIPAPIVGDPARLQQIVWNLVSNAIKFTKTGGSVTVRLRTLDDTAEIMVLDTGVGIRSDFLPDIFERFRQDAASTTRRHGGLGLGLSITKHLAELHGGSVHAWSAGEGQGSTFTVHLPLRSTELTSDEVMRRRESQIVAIQAETVSLRDVKVLVVEDDQDTRDLARRLLEAHRAEVFVAATAPEALEMILAVLPDILVSDIGLPDVDGYELIRRIRQMDGAIANIPAIALTAFARIQDRTQALRAGFNAHVAKPVEPAELVITVGSFANLIAANRER
jgi:PAS domain S-box-containing protein